MSGLNLNIPYPLQLEKSNLPRLLLTGCHLALAINPTLVLFMPLPLGGWFVAVILWFAARLRRTPYTKQAVNDAFYHLLLALLLILILTYIHVLALTTNWPTKNYIWLILLALQTPLSLYDARELFHGRTVLKFHREALNPFK